jgi:hypothetical protein
MANTYTAKMLAFGQLPATVGDLYAPSGEVGLVHTILLHNANTISEQVTINYYDGSNTYRIWYPLLSAGETVILSFGGEGDIVEDVDKYTGLTTTASKVTYKIIGSERVTS